MIFGWPLYYKPIDTIRCLKFTFSDPNHSEQNIPFVLHEDFVLTQKIMPKYSYFFIWNFVYSKCKISLSRLFNKTRNSESVLHSETRLAKVKLKVSKQ